MRDLGFDNFAIYATHKREPFFEIAREYAQSSGPCLDVGAGNGEFAAMLGRDDIYLVEGNPDSANALRRKYKNVYHLMLPSTLPFDDGQFGLIHCSHLIEHLHPEQLYELLKEFDRCVALGGHLVISTPLLWEGFFADLSHVKPYEPTVLRKYLCRDHQPEGAQRTRAAISSAYEEVRLVYRYRRKPVPIVGVSKGKRWLQRLAYGISTGLQKANVCTYERTGYTIVLRKET